MLKKILPILSVSFLFCMSCQQFSQSIRDTVDPNHQQVENGITVDDKLEAAEAAELVPQIKEKVSVASRIEYLQDAEDALRNLPEFRGKPIVFYGSVHFYNDGRIRTEIQNPDNTEFIDQYGYRDGQWSKGDPVVVTRSMRVEERLLPLDDMSFLAAYRVYHTVKEKMEEIGSEETMPPVYVVPNRGKPRWYPQTLRTDRSRYSIKFDTDGNLVEFERD